MSSSLHGHWQPIRAELSGEIAPAEALSMIELELTPTHYRVRLHGQVSDHGTTHADPGHDPGRLELRGIEGPNAGRAIPCIYQLNGDRLRISYGMDGHLPPDFTAPAGTTRYVVIYRRK